MTATTMPSYASGLSLRPLLGETIGDNFDRNAAAHPDREALVDLSSGSRWTYGQLRADVLALATGLLAVGIEKGDRVGIWAPNCGEWTLVQFAVAQVGAILVPINPAYRTHELRFVLNHSGVRLLVAAPSVKGVDLAAMISEVRSDCPALERAIVIGDDCWHALSDCTTDVVALRRRQATMSPDDPTAIQYTSGTTGNPKGATLSHHNILNNAHVIGELLDYTQL